MFPTEADGKTIIPLSMGRLPLTTGGKIMLLVSINLHCLCNLVCEWDLK